MVSVRAALEVNASAMRDNACAELVNDICGYRSGDLPCQPKRG